MSDAPETIWVEDVKPEMGNICWRDNIFFVDATASASGVGCNGRLTEYRRADLPAPDPMDDPRVKALVDAGDVMANALFGDYIVPGSASGWRAALAAMETE